MSRVLFCADLHLGHKNIVKYRHQFATVEEHRNHIHDRWHSRVGKNDVVMVLGDACFSQEAVDDLATWTGSKILIAGNHDTEHLHMLDLSRAFYKIHGLLRYKKFWLSHAPIHPAELRGKPNIHGHVHSETLPDDRYLNVSMEGIDYTPLHYTDVEMIFRQRGILK